MTRHAFVLACALLMTLVITDAAQALYYPTLGRFAQRDPHGTALSPENRPGATAAANGAFAERDPVRQYVDGGNLYQYVGSSPAAHRDPSGLTSKPDKQCELNGQKVTMAFNGITFVGHGFSAPAFSGRQREGSRKKRSRIVSDTSLYAKERRWWEAVYDYSKERQRMNWVGPTKEGRYWIDVCCTNSADNAWRHSYWDPLGRRSAWGDHSWHLHPYPDTDMSGTDGDRENFFLHGSRRVHPGTAGCIDIRDQDTAFKTDIVDRSAAGLADGECCYIDVVVDYVVEERRAKYGHRTIIHPKTVF